MNSRAGGAHAARFRRFEQGQREREHHERQGRGHGHDDARHRQVAGDEQAERERHEHDDRAERLRGAGQVQLVHLLQPPFVHVGQAVHHLVHVYAQADGEHVLRVPAYRAVRHAYCHHEGAGYPAVQLVVRERVRLVKVRHLVGAHAVVGQEHEQHARDERHGEHAGLLHAHQLRDHHGEHGEHHAPCADAQGVPHVVACGAVRGVLLLLGGQRALRHGTEQPVAPVVHRARDEVGLAGLARLGVAGSPSGLVAAALAERCIVARSGVIALRDGLRRRPAVLAARDVLAGCRHDVCSLA